MMVLELKGAVRFWYNEKKKNQKNQTHNQPTKQKIINHLLVVVETNSRLGLLDTYDGCIKSQ